MEKKPYHHGNLRSTLIEAGIELINKEGIQQFSLRKVAAQCEVSHAAPYSHFKSKEDLLKAMKSYATDKFVDVLEDTIKNNANSPELITHLGKSYVMFFVQNPQYFPFLISQADLQIDMENCLTECSNFQPFEIFKAVAIASMEKWGLPKVNYKKTLIAMWSVVHGIAAMATMKGVHYNGDWGTLTEAILKENIKIGGIPHDARVGENKNEIIDT